MKTSKLNTIPAIVLLVVVLFSCTGEELKHKVIISKSNESYFNAPLIDGWCRFFYKTHENSAWIEFKDKCGKYNIGDTLVIPVSNHKTQNK